MLMNPFRNSVVEVESEEATSEQADETQTATEGAHTGDGSVAENDILLEVSSHGVLDAGLTESINGSALEADLQETAINANGVAKTDSVEAPAEAEAAVMEAFVSVAVVEVDKSVTGTEAEAEELAEVEEAVTVTEAEMRQPQIERLQMILSRG